MKWFCVLQKVSCKLDLKIIGGKGIEKGERKYYKNVIPLPDDFVSLCLSSTDFDDRLFFFFFPENVLCTHT